MKANPLASLQEKSSQGASSLCLHFPSSAMIMQRYARASISSAHGYGTIHQNRHVKEFQSSPWRVPLATSREPCRLWKQTPRKGKESGWRWMEAKEGKKGGRGGGKEQKKRKNEAAMYRRGQKDPSEIKNSPCKGDGGRHFIILVEISRVYSFLIPRWFARAHPHRTE